MPSNATVFLIILGIVATASCCSQVNNPTFQDDFASNASTVCPEEKTVVHEYSSGTEEEGICQQEEESDGGPEIFVDSSVCYRLQPSVQAKSAGKKKKKKDPGILSCCQPQSLIYARCRSGIASCRLGDTSPIQWFSCAKSMGNVTSTPAKGVIMVLDANKTRRMGTGHPVYVENAKKIGKGRWQLRISHTNYDRQCHLDKDAIVIFNTSTMTASFITGPWSCWASDLKVLGFILR